LQNPQIVSISPQSHCASGANASLSPNNCNASLPREGCACAATCCMVCCSQHKRLLRSYGVSDGPVDFVCCLAHRFLSRQLEHSHANSNVSWLNYVGTLRDTLPSPGVNPLDGSPKCSCGKRDSEGRSRLPTLERGKGSSWEPRD
jgi:hypothetical protein